MATTKLTCNTALADLLAERKRLRDRELEIAEDRKIIEQRVFDALETHLTEVVAALDEDGKSLTSSIKLYSQDGDQIGEITGIGYSMKLNQVLAEAFVEEFPHTLGTLFKREYKAAAKPVMEQLLPDAPETALKVALGNVISYSQSTPRLTVK